MIGRCGIAVLICNDDRSTSFETNHRRDVPVSAGFGIPENSIFLVLEKLNSQY
jgi:hypothetical protein